MSDDTEHDDKERSGSWITVLAWSPDSTLLATGGTDGDTRIVGAGSGEVRHRLQLDGPVCALAWSPDGTQLAVACTDGNASIIDAASGEVRHRLDGADGGAPADADIEHGEAQLEDLQKDIDKTRSETGQHKEEQTANESESEVAAPG